MSKYYLIKDDSPDEGEILAWGKLSDRNWGEERQLWELQARVKSSLYKDTEGILKGKSKFDAVEVAERLKLTNLAPSMYYQLDTSTNVLQGRTLYVTEAHWLAEGRAHRRVGFIHGAYFGRRSCEYEEYERACDRYSVLPDLGKVKRIDVELELERVKGRNPPYETLTSRDPMRKDWCYDYVYADPKGILVHKKRGSTISPEEREQLKLMSLPELRKRGGE